MKPFGDGQREEATGNLCLGTRAAVRERVGSFLAGLARRKEEVRRRCRTVLQSRAEALQPASLPDSPSSGKCTSHFGFSLVLQRQFREGCGVMPAWRRGAWHGNVWPVR